LLGDPPNPAKDGKEPEDAAAPLAPGRPALELGPNTGLPDDPRTADTKDGYAALPGTPEAVVEAPVAAAVLLPVDVAAPNEGKEPLPPLLGPDPDPLPIAAIVLFH
jgi:hypothetical protein